MEPVALPRAPAGSSNARLAEHTDVWARAFVDGSPDRVFRLAADGTYLGWYAPDDATTALPPATFVGRRIEDVLAPPLAVATRDALDECVRSGVVQQYEYSVDLSTGERAHYECRMVPLGTDEVLAIARDVTARVDAERAQARGAARFRAIVQHSSELVVVLDEVGAIAYVSPSVEPLLGYRDHAVLGRNAFEFLHPDEVAGAWEQFVEAVKEPGLGVPLEMRLRDATGRFHVFELVASNMFHEPDVRGIVFHGRDVTERREAQRRLELLFEHSPVAQLLFAPDGTGLSANTAFAQLFGYDAEALVARHVTDLVAPEDRESMRLEYENLRHGRCDDITTNRRYVRSDGSAFFGRATVKAVRDDDGSIVYLVATVEDVTERVRAAEALADSEARFRALVDHSPDIVTIVYPNGVWSSNQQGTRLLGYPRGYDADGGVLSFVHPQDRDAALLALREVVDGHRNASQPIEVRLQAADGTYRPFECIGENFGHDEAIGGVVITARDISERKRMEHALRTAQQQFQVVFEHAPFSVSLVDLDGRIVDINFAGCAMLGRTREELIGTDASATVHPDDVEHAIATTTRQLGGDDVSAEFRLVRRDGQVAWVMSSAALIDDDDNPYIVTVQADITARHELEDRLAHEATRDPLTGLFNRGAFLTQLELALARRSPEHVGLLFVDLDHFKQVNDTLGHDAGDAVLATIAKRVLDVVRDGDAVARIGGDEFVVLCQNLPDIEEAALIAERVRATTDRPVEVRGGLAKVGASVGVAVGRAGDHPPALLRAADMAAYEAKRAGRGRVVVDRDPHPERRPA